LMKSVLIPRCSPVLRKRNVNVSGPDGKARSELTRYSASPR
jgi:hypothetical protein